MSIKILDFINENQYKATLQAMLSEEGDFFRDKIESLKKLIENMPGPYGTKDEPEKICQLHYFIGGSDWYIIEKDNVPDEKQHQAFGFACLNGDMEMAELGYISIQELIENGVELDYYFDPTPLKEILNQHKKAA